MEELRFPTTASHRPGLLRERGRKSRGSPRKPDSALVGTLGDRDSSPQTGPPSPSRPACGRDSTAIARVTAAQPRLALTAGFC